MYGERANFTGLVLACVVTDFPKQILVLIKMMNLNSFDVES